MPEAFQSTAWLATYPAALDRDAQIRHQEK
jgi:hypothetical protein